MLYIDTLADSTREWLDAMKTMQTSSPENSIILQSIQQSVLRIEYRMDALEGEKKG